MNCVKCGREISDGQAFCRICLADMEDYPVKPGTVVLLPKAEPALPAKKTSGRKRPSTEEQLALTKKKLRGTRWIAVFLIAVIIALCTVVYIISSQLGIKRFWGQNYSTVTTSESAGTSDRTKPDLPPASP